MKTKFFAVLAAALMLTVGGGAQAAVYSPDDILTAGETYSYFSASKVSKTTSQAWNFDTYLDNNTVAAFTYTLGGDAALKSGAVWGNVVSSTEDLEVENELTKVTDEDSSGTYNKDNLFISAIWDKATMTGSFLIKNITGEVVDLTLVIGAILNGYSTLTVEGSVTAVPLPAALPLFGLGIASLAGYGIKRRKEAA